MLLLAERSTYGYGCFLPDSPGMKAAPELRRADQGKGVEKSLLLIPNPVKNREMDGLLGTELH